MSARARRTPVTSQRPSPVPSPQRQLAQFADSIEAHVAMMQQRDSAWEHQSNEAAARKLCAPAAVASPEVSVSNPTSAVAPPSSGHAASLYLSSLASPGASNLDQTISSAATTRRASMTLPENLRPAAVESPSVDSPDPSSGSGASTPSAASDTNYETMSAAFRSQRLSIDDSEPEVPHLDTVRSALSRAQSKIDTPSTSKSLPRSNPSATASLLLSSELLILADPTSNLLFSLNSTLVQGVVKCDGMNQLSEDEEGTIELKKLEVFTFEV
jgi:hypothetical protein